MWYKSHYGNSRSKREVYYMQIIQSYELITKISSRYGMTWKGMFYSSTTISNGQVIALLGQTSSQFPHHLVQPVHLCASSYRALSSTIIKALHKHTWMQTPPPSHFSLFIWGIQVLIVLPHPYKVIIPLSYSSVCNNCLKLTLRPFLVELQYL